VASDLDFCTSCGQLLNPTLTGPGEPREERRRISVLFVDLVGFTSIGETLDPEDLRRLQTAYFSTASAAIRRYGGIVEKYIGDAVMALFGVPVETEHDALRAVMAGLDLQQALDNKPLAGRYRMRARVGITTGEALVDLSAARHAGQAVASGDVVATAARLQHHAPPGGVAVSTATWRATRGTIRYAEEPLLVKVHGKSAPIQIWLAQEPLRRSRVADDELSPLIGRQHELDMLTTFLTRCIESRHGHLVSVVGAHGLGKSRLTRELHRRVDDSPNLLVRWRVGRCLPYGEGSAYAALAEIIKSDIHVQDNDGPEKVRERLSVALGELVDAGEVERLAHLLGPLVGLPGREAGQDETEAAWRQVFYAMARRSPTVLVLEDLNFAQPTMLRFLTSLVEGATDVPLFVLATYRPDLLEQQPTWATALPGAFTVTLGPLRGAELRTLISTMLDRHGLPQSLRERLADITGGNPMYVLEYIWMLAEQAADSNLEPGAELQIPESVHGVIASRIDLLDQSERTVLRAACVLGETVWSGAIASMLNMDPAEVDSALRRLERRDMLVRHRASVLAGEAEFGYRHLLLRTVAYNRLPRNVRLQLHRAAATWFEQVLTTGRSDFAAAVARHWVAALQLAEDLGEDTTADARAARRALTTAAEAEFAAYAVEPALKYIEQALSLWPRDDEPDLRRAAELLHHRLAFFADRDTFYREGGPKELARLAERMREAGDRYGEARAATLLGEIESLRTAHDRARDWLLRAVSLFEDLPPSAAKAEAYSALARLYVLEYRITEAIEAARTARRLAEPLGLADIAAHAWITEATMRYLTADPDAVSELERVVEHTRAHHLPAYSRALNNLGTILEQEGELSRAAAVLAESRSAAGARVNIIIGYDTEAWQAYYSGDWVTLLRSADAYFDAQDTETTDWDLQLRGRRACLRALTGQSPAAEIARCVEFAEQAGFVRLQFCAYATGALAWVLAGDWPQAVALLEALSRTWHQGPTTMTVEWLTAALHTASLLATASPDADQRPLARKAVGIVADILDSMIRSTRWTRVATTTITGARAALAGEYKTAGDLLARAADEYEAIGSVSDAVLTRLWAARAWHLAGDTTAFETCAEPVRAFAARNHVPKLADLLSPA